MEIHLQSGASAVANVTILATSASNEPLWFRMLLAWKDEDPTRTGLTLPFLIGAALRDSVDVRVLDKDTAFAELATMLTEIWRTIPMSYVVRIGYCDKVEAPVAAIYASNKPDGRRRAQLVPFPTERGSKLVRGDLFAEAEYFAGKRRDLDALTDGLDKIVGPAIRSGKLSRRNRANMDFDDDDRAFIARVRAKHLVPTALHPSNHAKK